MKPADAARAGYKYWLAERDFRRPLQVGLAVNNTCNTFCEMCNIWKMKPKHQLSIPDIRDIFGSELFSDCVTVSLTGGEPTMRKDFAEIPLALADVMPSLGRIALTTNGYATNLILEHFESFIPALAKRGIAVSVNVSIDGIGDTHNTIRNNKRAWGHLVETLDRLAELRTRHRFNLVLACTLSAKNAHDAESVLAFAKQRDLYVIFRNAFTISRIDSIDSYANYALSESQLEQLGDFYRELLGSYDRSAARSRYYTMLLEMMEGAERSVPCLYRKSGLFIDHIGDMYVCSVFSDRLGNALTEDPNDVYFGSREHRDELACGACKGCSHDVSLFLSTREQGIDRLKAAITSVAR